MPFKIRAAWIDIFIDLVPRFHRQSETFGLLSIEFTSKDMGITQTLTLLDQALP